MSVCQLQPESRGFVRIKSPDPLAAPAMQPNYLSTERDRMTLVAGIRWRERWPRRRRSRLTSPASTGRARRGERRGAARIREEHRRHDLPSVGTCKMGPACDPLAVVDHELNVRGLEGIPRRRLQHDADARVGQHQRAGGDDRREDRRPDARALAIT
jgi:choline dehydrogenase